MSPARSWSLLCLTLAGALVSGCDGRSDTETASVGATVAEANRNAIPITSASEEARRLYLEGRALSEQLRAHDARKRYEQAVASDRSFAMAHYQLAINSATAKDFFEHLKHAKANADKVSEGERLMILALEAGGNADPGKALEYLEQLVAKYPSDERAHFQLGGNYLARQEYEKAIEQYKKAIEINPTFSPVYNSLGYAYRPLEKYAEAEAAFKKYIELIPSDPNPYDSYAELLMKTGRFDESIAQYRKALQVDSNFTPSRVGIATNLMLQGKHDEAASVMDELHRRARDDGDRRTALFVKGVVLVDAGRTDAALKEIEKELVLDTGLGDTANMSGDVQLIGDIQLDAGRTDKAEQSYRRALELIEKSSLSDDVKQDTRLAHHYNLGRLALARRDLPGARSHAEQYLTGSQSRQNPFRIRQAHELTGRIALAEKKFDDAIAHLAQANQQDPFVIYTMAKAYKGKGDAPKAKELAGRAANANILPLVTYAFIRQDATKL
jgi:tetratricopeptide (TPR) repeat protein